MGNPLLATKSVDELRESADVETGLKRSLSAVDLVLLGIGAIIGTGIFVLTGTAAATSAGPAVCLSFIVAAIVSGFAGLCYAEMASMIPVSGSAYTYAYATMGELVAWIIGWDLILEYMAGASAVSVGWSGYFIAFIEQMIGKDIPSKFTNAPVKFDDKTWEFVATGDVCNVPAMIIVALVTLILIRGVKESARFNGIIVVVKIAVVLLFIVFAAPFINVENWQPFIPPNEGQFGKFGMSGIFRAASLIFFAYIGFDAVSTAAQETKNPKKDMPIGILGSLSICTVLYIAVSLILTGVVHYTKLNVAHPIAVGIQATGIGWLEIAVEVGAIAGLSSVLVVMLMGQPRIFFTMAQDGLFPQFATKVHPRFGTPYITTIVTGILVATAGGLLPIDLLGEATNVGTLFAFVLVCAAVMILRIKRPDVPRSFTVPGGPYLVPILGMASSAGLIFTSTMATQVRLWVWMAIGLGLYFAYGAKHSKLRQRNKD